MATRSDHAPATPLDLEAVDAVVEQTQALELLRRAIDRRATDIHLDPQGNEFEVRFRIDGRLEHYCRHSDDIGKHLMSQLLIMADLDPSEPFHPREGHVVLPPSLSDYDVRITATPAASGRTVALRLLRRDQLIRPLETLGLAEGPFQEIARLKGSGEGVVLVSGPSGSGKSTTLYSLLHALDDGGRKIVTIEDPVEYLVPAFVQLQVDLKHGLRPSDELRTVLRMDPDVILIGEIRDRETAAAAMQAASCGKYVFSTFHSRDAAGVITGLRDLGIDDRSAANNLRAVVSQRLVRRVCRGCRRMMPPEAAERALFEEEGLPSPNEVPVAVGCADCRGTGYHDRIGVFEIATIGADVVAAIESGKSERELRKLLRSAGVASLRHDALEKAAAGVTTLEEVRQMSRLGRT
jgi:type II secretory ATPase GspE/PulE/Tfp pilus assembly ATPase PilB-like protein